MDYSSQIHTGYVSVLLQEQLRQLTIRWHHDKRTLCWESKAASQDISQVAKFEHKWSFQMSNDGKHMTKIAVKSFKDDKDNVLESSS